MGETISSLVRSLGLKGPQQTAVTTRQRDVVVIAGAGSGKTRTLVARYLSLLDEGLLPRQVVAVTFTEKAAREMRNRIRAAVTEWRNRGCPAEDRPRWDEIEADIDGAPIGTIHSLCASILRAHPAEAGIDPLASVLDEGIAAVLKAEAIEDSLAWASGESSLGPLFASFSIDDLRRVLATLLANRMEARSTPGTLDISERWRRAILDEIRRFTQRDEIVQAIAAMDGLQASGQLDADAGEKLANQARGLLGQWHNLGQLVQAGDATAAAGTLQVLRRDYTLLTIGRKQSLAKDAVRAFRERYNREVAPWLGDGKGALPDADAEMQAVALVSLIRRLGAKANEVYQRSKDLRQALDFDDLESRAVELLAKPEIRRRWQRQIAALLVDEFQDTNARQRYIVESLAGSNRGAGSKADAGGKLFVVGDAKQSIYGFRGADVSVFRGLARETWARGGQALELDFTFRAHKGLVDAVNELLGHVMGVADDPRRPYSAPFTPLTAQRLLPRPRYEVPYVEFLVGQGDTADDARTAAAALLSRRLLELRDREGIDWCDVALLFRAAGGFPAYEGALDDAGIPFVTVAGRGFYDRPEIRDLLNMIRAIADPSDDLAMAGLLRSPAFGVSDAALYRLRWAQGADRSAAPVPFLAALRGSLAHLSPADREAAGRAYDILTHLFTRVDRVTVSELVKALLDATRYQAVLAAARPGLRLQRNVEKLLADARTSGLVSVTEYLQYVETLREAGAREGEAPSEAGGAVRLMTVHKAKGLQFPVVVIADASRARPSTSPPLLLSREFGIVPMRGGFDRPPLICGLAGAIESARAEAEDLRTLYVAATRAQERVLRTLCIIT